MDLNRKCVKILPLEMKSPLKCGVCDEFLVIPPIYSCLSVKYICGPCFEGYRYYLDNDELRAADQPIRQILYENYACRIRFPCSYYPLCRGVMTFDAGAKLHYKENCFAKVLWIFKCPISRANRWFLRPGQTHCEEKFNRIKLYDNENVKLMRHLRITHSKYILHKPYKLHLKNLKNNGRSRQLFLLLLEENDIVAVLMTEITKTDIIFRCRVNDAVDSRSMEADPYECCVNLVPPHDRFCSIVDVKFECVQFDSKDVDYPWQSLRLPIRHLIDETVFKICVLPRSLMLRSIPYLHRDRQLYSAVDEETIYCSSEATLSNPESARTDIELLSLPSSNSENQTELWGLEEREELRGLSPNEKCPENATLKYEENNQTSSNGMQEEVKWSASRRLFRDDRVVSNGSSTEDIVSNQRFAYFEIPSASTYIPDDQTEIITIITENEEHDTIEKKPSSKNRKWNNRSLEHQPKQKRIPTSNYEADDQKKTERLQEELKGTSENLSADDIDVSNCSSSEDIMPNLELVPYDLTPILDDPPEFSSKQMQNEGHEEIKQKTQPEKRMHVIENVLINDTSVNHHKNGISTLNRDQTKTEQNLLNDGADDSKYYSTEDIVPNLKTNLPSVSTSNPEASSELIAPNKSLSQNRKKFDDLHAKAERLKEILAGMRATSNLSIKDADISKLALEKNMPTLKLTPPQFSSDDPLELTASFSSEQRQNEEKRLKKPIDCEDNLSQNTDNESQQNNYMKPVMGGEKCLSRNRNMFESTDGNEEKLQEIIKTSLKDKMTSPLIRREQEDSKENYEMIKSGHRHSNRKYGLAEITHICNNAKSTGSVLKCPCYKCISKTKK